MKKAFIFLLALLVLSGCSLQQQEDQKNTTAVVEPTPKPSSTPEPVLTPVPTSSEVLSDANSVEVPQGDKVYFGNFEINHSFDAIGTPPTYIRIIENDTIITWGVEAGLVINTENNPYGGTFTGVMTEIAENIFAVEGDFFYLDYAGQYDNLVSEDTDFYIILRKDTLYGVFEPMSVYELEEYVPADVYKYGGSK